MGGTGRETETFFPKQISAVKKEEEASIGKTKMSCPSPATAGGGGGALLLMLLLGSVGGESTNILRAIFSAYPNALLCVDRVRVCTIRGG